ncbi:hypothetical protein C8Q74DRAFT_1213778 [Fomes fomentarius]|nr:hypothetical protein C8Q74DRAFT_1213778 [Fomes fomentarius]
MSVFQLKERRWMSHPPRMTTSPLLKRSVVWLQRSQMMADLDEGEAININALGKVLKQAEQACKRAGKQATKDEFAFVLSKHDISKVPVSDTHIDAAPQAGDSTHLVPVTKRSRWGLGRALASPIYYWGSNDAKQQWGCVTSTGTPVKQIIIWCIICPLGAVPGPSAFDNSPSINISWVLHRPYLHNQLMESYTQGTVG